MRKRNRKKHEGMLDQFRVGKIVRLEVNSRRRSVNQIGVESQVRSLGKRPRKEKLRTRFLEGSIKVVTGQIYRINSTKARHGQKQPIFNKSKTNAGVEVSIEMTKNAKVLEKMRKFSVR